MSWLDVSLETGNNFYTWGWRGSILGAVITAIAVIFLMWGTRIRDHDAELQAKQSATQQDELRKSNDELRSQIQILKRPRTISKDTASQITAILRTSGKHTFQIIYVGMDAEAQKLAEQIKDVFEAAEWRLIGPVQPQFDLTRAPPVGVELGVKSQQNIPPVLEPFVDLMRKEKLIGPKVSVGVAPELEDELSLAVLIGHKPI